MKRIVWSAFFAAVACTLALAVLLFSSRPARAQTSELCYAVADNGGMSGSPDVLVTLNRTTAVTTPIGETGTSNIEAIAFTLGAETLFAANGGQLGTLDLTTAEFTPLPEPIGAGDGAAGNVTFNDVDGLTIDPRSGVLYGTHRRSGSSPDLLLQINPSTGAHVPDAFGPGVDYVVIDGPSVLGDVDDIAVDPVTGQMYAASNSGGEGGVLVNVDKATGDGTLVGEFGVDDIEGMAYFNDGRLYGSTGRYTSGPGTTNSLYLIDETTAEATLVAPFSEQVDYEGLDCLTEPTSVSLAEVTANARFANLWLLAVLLGLGSLTAVVMARRGF